MTARVRDSTRYIMGPNPGLPSGVPCTSAGIAEHMRGHALYYWHPAERQFGNGPGCAIGHWLWNLAATLEADSAELQRKASGPIPRQRKAS